MATTATILTDIQTNITNGPSAASSALAIAAAGPITDLLGMYLLAQSKCKEVKVLVKAIIAVTDAGDGNLTRWANIRDTFV